jgi:hypothetical protein
MLQVVEYTLGELLRERREGAVRAIIRAIGYALARGRKPEDVGQFLFDSYRLAGEFRHQLATDGEHNGTAFAGRHMLTRAGWSDDLQVRVDKGGYVVESASMLRDHDAVLGFHGVTRLDFEACMETYWSLSGHEMGLEVTYTIGDEKDWAVIRAPGGGGLPLPAADVPQFSPESLAAHRRIALASGITFSIGFAKMNGDEPEDLGHFFYKVWEHSGHYDRLRDRWGYGNALAYAQNLIQSRQVLYTKTELSEDLDGYTISSPSWATEIPMIMGTFGCLPDDVYRYYEGGGIPACAKLGLQYADRSNDRIHGVWVRSR